MDHMEWTAAYSVGVEDIDDQHRRLISIINRLLATGAGTSSSDEILAVLSDLVDYTDYHFRTEDNYMMENEYPLFLTHRKEHLAYLKKMGDFVAALERKEDDLLDDILAYLTDWWETHITKSDMRYARYIQKQSNKK